MVTDSTEMKSVPFIMIPVVVLLNPELGATLVTIGATANTLKDIKNINALIRSVEKRICLAAVDLLSIIQ